jgi:hypothetical protein
MSRKKKYWKRRFGDLTAESMQPYYQHLDFRGITDLEDEGLAYLLTHVKGIKMLDLNEADITNASITLLTKMEYLNELRLKECTEIDNNCIADLNKITSLQFLHVKNTGITIDGLLQLNALTKLTEILFSEEDTVAIKDKMLLLKDMLPDCKFVINSIPYIF